MAEIENPKPMYCYILLYHIMLVWTTTPCREDTHRPFAMSSSFGNTVKCPTCSFPPKSLGFHDNSGFVGDNGVCSYSGSFVKPKAPDGKPAPKDT